MKIKSFFLFVFCRLENRHLNGLDTGQVRRILHEALKVWEKNSKLVFRETSSSDADIQILFAR